MAVEEGNSCPPKKPHERASNRQRNGVFLYDLFSYCRLNEAVLLRWLMEAVMEVVMVCSSDRRPTVYGMSETRLL